MYNTNLTKDYLNNIVISKLSLAAISKEKGDYLDSWELYDEVLMDDINNEYALIGLINLLLKTNIIKLDNTSQEKFVYLLRNYYFKFRMVIKRKLREEDYTPDLLNMTKSTDYCCN